MFYSPKRKYNYDIKNDEKQNNNNEENNKNINESNLIDFPQTESKMEQLEFQKQIYNLNFSYSKNNNSISLELSPKIIDSLQNLYYYKNVFSYSDLLSLCKSFRMYDSIQEIFSSFCIICQNKKAFLKINENNSFNLVLLISSVTGKEEEVCFPLERQKVIQEKNTTKDNISSYNIKWDEKEKELNSRIENLEKSLRQENYDLKNEIYYLKNDINRYVKTIDNNKKEIKYLKEQIKSLKNSFETKIKNITDKITFLNNPIIIGESIPDINTESDKNKNEQKDIIINPKIQKEKKISNISKKNIKVNNNKNNIANENQKKNNKNEFHTNKLNNNHEKMKNNKREIYKQMKEENAKKLNVNKEKSSFSEFLKQKKIKNVNNKNNQINKSYTESRDNFIKKAKMKEDIQEDLDDENIEEEKEIKEKDIIHDEKDNNNNSEEENIRYKNLSNKNDNEEKYDEKDDYLNKIKINEVNRSYIIDQWTQDFNLNVKKLLEDNDIKLKFTEKLNNMNRRIITKIEELQLIENQLTKEYPNIKDIKYNLIYRSSENGDSAKIFHEKCNVSENLVLIKCENDIKFGGYTKEKWEGKNLFKKDENAFCFSLNKNKIYKVEENKSALYCDENMGPCFGDKFFQIYDNFLTKGGICFNQDKCGYINIEDDRELTNGIEYFPVEEIEVYKLKFIY